MAPALGPDEGKPRRMDFEKLESLRLFSKQILENQTASLDYFKYDVGYQHFKGKHPLKISVSSSATCILSLVATDKWNANAQNTKKLFEYLTSRKKSAGLRDNNPFTIAWILDGVTALQTVSSNLGQKAKLARMSARRRHLASKPAAISLSEFRKCILLRIRDAGPAFA